MENDKKYQRIKKYIEGLAFEKNFKINESTNLYDSGVFDSLAIIEFLTFLDEEMNVSIDMDDLDFENFETLDSILKWLK